MSTRKLKRSPLWALALIAALGVGVSACVHDGGSDTAAPVDPPVVEPAPEPTVYSVTLPDGHGLAAGTITVAAGQMTETAGGTQIACPGTEDCTVTVMAEAVTGALSASSTGGMVTVTTAAGREAAQIAANKMTLADAETTLAEVQARYDAGDATKNELEAAKKAVADAMKLDGNEPAEPTEPPPVASACDTSGTSAACVAEKKMALDDAKDALDAVNADDSSTLAEVKAAKNAVTVAQTAYNEAKAARDTHLAMQTPTFEPGTMDAALKASATSDGQFQETMVTRGKLSSTSGYKKASWAFPAISGWASRAYEFKDLGVGVTESVVVYSSASGDRSARYLDYYKFDAAVGGGAGGWSDPPAGYSYKARSGLAAPTAALVDGKVAIQDAVMSKTESALFKASKLPTGTQNVQTYTTEAERTFSGSYNDISGKFSCTGTCTISTTVDGYFDFSTGWSFTPTSTAIRVAGVAQDAEYLDFGYWVETEKIGDTTVYRVDAFASGSSVRDASGVTAGTTATYKGSAAGIYVKRTFTTAGVAAASESGRFTATAELTAEFGNADNASSIRGTISNFEDGDRTIDPSWRVSLPETESIARTTGVFSGSDSGTDWSGTFRDLGSSTTTAAPKGVSGEFSSNLHNGRVVGAFGANKQQ